MQRCDDYEPLIERMLAEEIGDAERDRLLSHAESCAGCRQFVELHHRLLEPGTDPELPSESEFLEARRNVMRRIRSGSPATERAGLSGFFRSLTLRPAFAGGLAAAIVAAVALGVLIGREIGGPVITLERPTDVDRDPLLIQIREEARGNRLLSDVEDSPYLYSNASFQDHADGTLTLSFDVTRHMEVRRPRRDPLVNEVLVQTMLSPSPVGTRLDALSYAGNQADEKIRQALIFSMLDDPNLAVRLRALTTLSKFEPDDETQAAFLAVLRGEEAVQMRLLALDWLAGSELSHERLDEVLRDLGPEDDSPLWIRAARYDLGPNAR